MALSAGIAGRIVGLEGLRELALFAGCGGGILGGKLLDWRCVCAVEIEAYCREALLQRQRDALLPLFPIWDDVKTFQASAWRGAVDIVTGGFPCQPFSTAGRQKGSNDARNMWPETIRCLREVGPRIALLENVPGLLSFDYFGEILGDLAEAGYAAEWDVVSAAEVGAPHLRERLWILAYPSADACFARCEAGERKSGKRMLAKAGEKTTGFAGNDLSISNARKHGCPAVPAQKNSGAMAGGCSKASKKRCPQATTIEHGRQDAASRRSEQSLQGSRQSSQDGKTESISKSSGIGQAKGESVLRESDSRRTPSGFAHNDRIDWRDWWSPQSGLGGTSHGLAKWLDGSWEEGIPRVTQETEHRIERLKAIGNGQVPQTVRKAFLMLAERAGLLVPDGQGNWQFIG